MKGKVLFFDTEKNRGVIEDKNKNQYSFHIGEWIGEERAYYSWERGELRYT